jgi:putative FmdB family regulatory protein
MPTYEYRCPEGHEFEVFQKMSDPPGATCPECGEDAERRLSGGAGLLFKGSGFYITDYRSEDYKKAAAKESGDAKGSTDGAKDAGTKPAGGSSEGGRAGSSSKRGGGDAPPKGASAGGDPASNRPPSSGGDAGA